MPDSQTPLEVASPRPRARHTAAGVVAQYIHELSERHAETARERASQISASLPIAARPATC